jgi:hypothetical protein
MAGFCRNCGTALGDGQGFCVKCGTRVGDASQPSGVPPAAAPPAAAGVPPPAVAVPAAAYVPPQAAPPTSSGMSPLVKILIGVVIVFGAFAAAGVLYIGHRVHEKAAELGLTRTPEQRRASREELRRIDGCSLLSKADVAQAVKMDIVRVESTTGDPGCTYSVSGDPADMTAKHVSALHKNEMNKAQQDQVENFGKTIFHSTNSGSDSAGGEHPGEAPVFSFSVYNNAPELQMRLNKATLGAMGPAITPSIPNLGDEAFDAAGAMIFIRKGDKVIRIMYMTCPCGLEDVLPLARKIADGL